MSDEDASTGTDEAPEPSEAPAKPPMRKSVVYSLRALGLLFVVAVWVIAAVNLLADDSSAVAQPFDGPAGIEQPAEGIGDG